MAVLGAKVNKQLKVNNHLTFPKIFIFHTQQLCNASVTWLWLSEPYWDKSEKNGQIQDLLCSSAAAGKNAFTVMQLLPQAAV